MNYYCKQCAEKKGLEVDIKLTELGWGGYCSECGACDLFVTTESSQTIGE
jgi:hypothetical protein